MGASPAAEAITPTLGKPCIDPAGAAVPDPALIDQGQCAAAGYEPNTADNPDVVGTPFSLGLFPFDLTRGGSFFNFHATANINQYAFFAQDAITEGNFQFTTLAVR